MIKDLIALDNPMERGYFCQMITCLLEIQKLQFTVKKPVHTGADFYVQSALKLTYEHL